MPASGKYSTHCRDWPEQAKGWQTGVYQAASEGSPHSPEPPKLAQIDNAVVVGVKLAESCRYFSCLHGRELTLVKHSNSSSKHYQQQKYRIPGMFPSLPTHSKQATRQEE